MSDLHLPISTSDLHLPISTSDLHVPISTSDLHVPISTSDLHVPTVGRTSIWYTADFAGFPTYKACRGL